MITVGVGLEGALVATLRTTPDVIRPEVTTLVSRIRSRWNTAEALRAFADQFNDSTGDLVAATLILAAQKRADGLAQILSGLAESVSAEVAARRHLEADRSKPRQTARIVTIITVVCLVGMAATALEQRDVFDARLMAEYDDEADDLRTQQFKVLLSDEWADGVRAAVDAALLGRYLERIADHAVLIGSRVVYIVTGLHPQGAQWTIA